jgi:TonB-like protein
MRQVLLFLLFTSFCPAVYCQMWGDSSLKYKPLFYAVEKAPKFPGGLSGYYKFLSENLKMPENTFSQNSHKLVIVRIIIDTNGKVVFGEIEKGLNENYNHAALDIIKLMPMWMPAIQNNHPVPVSLSLPVLFVD